MNKIMINMAALAAAAMLFSCSKDYENNAIVVPQPSIGNEVSTMVIYEANPRFFATQDCLNALNSNLQRISDLGCNVLWIMPVCEPSTAPESVGSPYSIKNFDVINPRYGTLADLQNLVSNAHGLGMKVILDWVPNHTGWDNPWITEHPDWFVHNDKGEIISPPGQNWKDVAQLDYSNPAVAEGMSEAIEYWVTAADVDGFRFDYASSPNIPASFWINLATDLKAMKSDIILLAECTDYNFYGYGYEMIYDWDSAPTISGAFTGGSANSVVEEGVNALANVPNGDSILRYVFNHDVMDQNPINSYFGSIDALPAAYVCASMLNGTPMIYSSMDAKGLTGTQSFFNYTQLTFSDELTPIYGAINNAFKASADVRRGTIYNKSTNKVVAFVKEIPSKKLFVAVNTTNQEQTITTPMSIIGLQMTDLINETSMVPGATTTLPAYGYCIYMN